MKRFWMLLVVTLTCLSLFAGVAEAKRFGGGSSFGKSRPAPTKQMQRAPEPAPQPAAPAQPGGANRWLGPLAGLAIGAGLATLFSHGGLGDFANNLSMILMFVAGAALLVLLVNKLRRPQPTSVQYAGAGTAATPTTFNSGSYTSAFNTSAFDSGKGAQQSVTIPDDFPMEGFLRSAKAWFIRLQAANDRKDLNDVREYTTPEVYAEISLQMQERGDATQVTEVVRLDAELLEVVSEGDYTIASVRYSGQLRENNGPIENIDEIWHLQKATQRSESPWLLAGIQQVA